MNLLQMSFYGATMIVVILALRAVCVNRLPKRTFIVLWEITLLRLLLPIAIPSVFSAYSLLSRNTAAVNKAGGMMTTGLLPELLAVQPSPSDNIPRFMQEKTAVSLWFLIWGAGALLCAAYFVICYWLCRRKFRASSPAVNEIALGWLEEHPLRRRVQIRQSDRIRAPLTYGILRPVILLPGNTLWEEEQRLCYILMHEYIHICRFDAAIKLIAVLALCMHWFNPLVWVMYFYFNRDIELACDEYVVRRFGQRSRSCYAMALIHMEERKSGLDPLCNSFSKNAIEERVKAIMKMKRKSAPAIVAAVLLIITVAFVFATTAQSDKEAAVSDDASGQNDFGGEEAPGGQNENDRGEIPDTMGTAADGSAAAPAESTASGEQELLEGETFLTIMMEGLAEEMPVTVYAGDGYSICVPRGWEQYGPDAWMHPENDMTQFWVTCFTGSTVKDAAATLSEEGYLAGEGEGAPMTKTQSDRILRALLMEGGDCAWGVFYSFPPEAEEGFGVRLHAVAQSFAPGSGQQAASGEDTPQLSAEAQAIKEIVEAFAAEYFQGNREAVKKYLTAPYEWDIEVPDGGSEPLDISIEGLEAIEEKQLNEVCVVSLRYKTGPKEDQYHYLTIELVKTKDGWNIQFYGVEG